MIRQAITSPFITPPPSAAMTPFLSAFPRLETIQLNDKIRASQSGSYVRLTEGMVHYELAGPEDGPLVVLVHGFSIPYYLWDPTFKALARAGLRCLRFDLFGRGYSDRPRARYNLTFFTRQIFNLLSALGLQDHPMHLTGVSMGGPISAAYAVEYPLTVKSLSLIDPAGLASPFGFSADLLCIPLLGEALFSLQNHAAVLSGLKIDLYRPDRFPEYVEQYLPQLRLRGTTAALLSTMRCGILDLQEDLFRRFAETGIPVQLVWGKEDLTFPFETSEKALKLLPEAEFLPVPEARHVPHYERPEIVNPALIDFIKRHQT